MNERIRQLANQAAGTKKYVPPVWQFYDNELEKFAELIIAECGHALRPMLRDMISRGQGIELIKKHFGIK